MEIRYSKTKSGNRDRYKRRRGTGNTLINEIHRRLHKEEENWISRCCRLIWCSFLVFLLFSIMETILIHTNNLKNLRAESLASLPSHQLIRSHSLPPPPDASAIGTTSETTTAVSEEGLLSIGTIEKLKAAGTDVDKFQTLMKSLTPEQRKAIIERDDKETLAASMVAYWKSIPDLTVHQIREIVEFVSFATQPDVADEKTQATTFFDNATTQRLQDVKADVEKYERLMKSLTPDQVKAVNLLSPSDPIEDTSASAKTVTTQSFENIPGLTANQIVNLQELEALLKVSRYKSMMEKLYGASHLI